MAKGGRGDKKTESKDVRKDSGGARVGRPRLGLVLLAGCLVVLLLIYAGAILYLRPSSPGRELSFDAVVHAAAANKVKTATLEDQDARVVGTVQLDAGGRAVDFWATYPKSDAATNDLLRTFLSGGTTVSIDQQSGKELVRFIAQFLLPLVILANLFALFFFLSRGSGGGASEFLLFGRVGNKRLGKEKGRTTFANVAAAEELIPELSEVRDYLADPRAFAAMGALPPKGVLLVGPPGCGKTLLARAVAGEAQANFYSVSGSEFVESLVGIGAARVRDLFKQARLAPPSIIFIDELDAVGRQRGAGLGGGHDEREQTLNELLVQVDGFSPTEGVVIMGATNRPDILDPALLRAGRFDRQITVERPDVGGRLAILQLHATGRRLIDPENDLPFIAKNTPGMTGADLASLLNESALLAVREKAPAINRNHLEEAADRVLSGPRRRGLLMSAEEKRRVAYHEAGHAVVAAALGKSEVLQKLSIIARGKGIGHLAVLQEDKNILTMPDMENQITIAMAGIAAEELVLGWPSTGSEQDLERATDTARDMAGRYGMSRSLGRVRVLRGQREVFLGRDYLLTQDVSQPTLETLDAEVRRILDEEEEVAREILVDHREILASLAAALITEETLQGPGLQKLLANIKPHVKLARQEAGGRRGR